MNQRERTLAIVVGSLVVGAVLFYGGKKLNAILTTRNDRIESLQSEVDTKTIQMARGRKANGVLDQYAKRSLPGDEFGADSRYRAWLHEWVEKSGVDGADVKWLRKQTVTLDEKRAHDIHSFQVMCRAGLPQLVDMLHQFYSQDYLHRISVLSARPVAEKVLMLNFTISAISMPGVADRELEDMPSQRLAFKDVEDYFDVIVGRNIYSPGNQPPKFASSQTESGYVNEEMSFRPDVDDPENDDLTYRVEPNGLEGITVDESSGRILWKPPATGEFEVLVYAKDNGIPAKESSQTIRLVVSEPPEEEPEEEAPPPPRFDDSKYTFVTGIVEVNGRRQVWLTVRTDGSWLRLYEGDNFQIGLMDGTIERIYPRSVEISTQDVRMAVRFGQSLREGQILSSEEDVAARE